MSAAPQETYHAFWAMGCTIELWLDCAEHAAQSYLKQAEATFEQYEAIFSRFRPESELSKLNRSAGGWQSISPTMLTVLDAALNGCRVTQGLYDCTILDALESAGYTASFEHSEKFQSRKVTGYSDQTWQKIELDPINERVFVPADTMLDFGGIVKGLTAQAVIDQIGDSIGCLVSAGGDLVAGAPPAGKPGWPVGVSWPWGPADAAEKSLYKLWLSNAALATSGIDYRRWQTDDGQTAHHIIDPRTRRPVQTDCLTATVLAGNVDMAEAWATAALILGAETAINLFETHHVAASVVTRSYELMMTSAMQAHAQLEETV
ncbi:MAG: FAD:protein FMN transferase [Chloroflexota bacterium]